MPRTPWSRTSSAILKALTMDVLSLETVSRRSLGMTMRVSTFSLRIWMPFSACMARRRPSKVNGRVTTPMVSAPRPLAISANTGAAPGAGAPTLAGGDEDHVGALEGLLDLGPVLLGGHARPTSGSLPAPRPRVSWRPMSSLRSASLISSAWASVLAAMNSTLRSPESIMRLTALTPPPPTPTTLMTAR